MEAVQHQRGIRTMVADGADIGLAHVTASPPDLLFLIGTEHVIEEDIYALAPFPGANPHHARAVQVIDQRGVLVPLAV